jgi:hypothetical protein
MSENIRNEKETSTSSVVGKPWILRREQLGASTQLLMELAAEDSDSYRNHLRMSKAQLEIFSYRKLAL